MGGYVYEGGTVYPLAYRDGSLRYFVGDMPQAAPAVTAGPPLVIPNVTVPAGGSVLMVYEAEVTPYAPLGPDAQIENTVSVTGPDLPAALTASATVPMESGAALSITKSVSPEAVAEGGTLTYAFTVQNTGPEPADAAAALTVTDTFVPALTGLSVTLDGSALARAADYTYDESTGVFATAAGRITVPAAAYAQNADGSWTVTPGAAVLTVSGTV